MATRPREKICVYCDLTWTTREPRSRTCSPKCRAALREIETPSKGGMFRAYPEAVVEKARRLYESGATIREVAAAIGPGYRAQTLIERFVVERRPAVPRDQTGERNAVWKGNAAGYGALHHRVMAARGRPARCDRCGANDPDARYEWANLTGDYFDVSDYERMCVPCHRPFDAARRAETGLPTSLLSGRGRDA